MKTIRQGDVLLIWREKAPEKTNGIKPTEGRYILARGEATGHHHSIAASPSTALMAGPNNTMWLLVLEGDALLEHQEHAPLVVTPGIIEVRRQRESADGLADWRLVAD